MIGSVTLYLPLKPYLKKYLVKKFGNEHQASRESWLGAYVIDILNKQYRNNKKVIPKEDCYPVTIPYSVVADVGFTVSKVKLLRLSAMIRKVFLNDLYSYINISRDKNLKVFDEKYESIVKQNAKKAITQFLDYYDISEDELNADSVYRQYTRDRKKDKSKESDTRMAV